MTTERTMPIRLRELQREDWFALRQIRLHALRTEPGLFFKSYEEEAGLADAEWIARASGDETHQLFGLFDGAELIGISAVVADRDDPTGATASFGMSYILPAYRRRGLGSRFYEARLAWAAARPQFVRAAIGHRRSNEASRRAITRFGFRWTHDEPHVWPDGQTEDDVCYELRLRDIEAGLPIAVARVVDSGNLPPDRPDAESVRPTREPNHLTAKI